MNFIQKFKSKKIDEPMNSELTIPEGWYVAEAGQNPLHMLWFVMLVNFDDVANKNENPRHVVAEECDSFEQALQECIKNCN
jgi:hypothetical protein